MKTSNKCWRPTKEKSICIGEISLVRSDRVTRCGGRGLETSYAPSINKQLGEVYVCDNELSLASTAFELFVQADVAPSQPELISVLIQVDPPFPPLPSPTLPTRCEPLLCGALRTCWRRMLLESYTPLILFVYHTSLMCVWGGESVYWEICIEDLTHALCFLGGGQIHQQLVSVSRKLKRSRETRLYEQKLQTLGLDPAGKPLP